MVLSKLLKQKRRKTCSFEQKLMLINRLVKILFVCVILTLVFYQKVSQNILSVLLLQFCSKKFCFLDACSGQGYAAPFYLFGPVSKGNTFVFGTFGRRQYYYVSAIGNLRPLVCCEGEGYRNGKPYWGTLGCRKRGVGECWRISGKPIQRRCDWWCILPI